MGKLKIEHKDILLQELSIDKRFTIFVEQGKLSKFDIRVRYKDNQCNKKRIVKRTPKHIHWACDILMKKIYNPQLINNLINQMLKIWEKTPHITKYSQRQDCLSIHHLWLKNKNKWKKYSGIDQIGEYNSKFIIILLQLLMLQEKANNKKAYLFPKLLGLLKQDNLNLWDIVSTATHK